MTIEIKLTCDTVTEAQAEMVALLRGTNITFGSEPKAPSTPAQPASSSPSSIESTPLYTPAASSASTPETSCATTSEPNSKSSELEAKYEQASEQPAKRGRGRPRKDAAPASATPFSTTPDAPAETTPESSDEEQIGPPLGIEAVQPSGATEPAEPTSDDASSTSSETVIASAEGDMTAYYHEFDARKAPAASVAEASGSAAEASLPAADIRPVSDTDLHRFCAKLAEKFGGSQKVFDACKPFTAKGDVARPTNIKRNEDRWAFIRQMEAQSGLTYHG